MKVEHFKRSIFPALCSKILKLQCIWFDGIIAHRTKKILSIANIKRRMYNEVQQHQQTMMMMMLSNNVALDVRVFNPLNAHVTNGLSVNE